MIIKFFKSKSFHIFRMCEQIKFEADKRYKEGKISQ